MKNDANNHAIVFILLHLHETICKKERQDPDMQILALGIE